MLMIKSMKLKGNIAFNDVDSINFARSDVVDARNQWIRVVRAILAGLELAEGVEDQTMARILQPLKSAVEKISSKSRAKEQPDSAPA